MPKYSVPERKSGEERSTKCKFKRSTFPCPKIAEISGKKMTKGQKQPSKMLDNVYFQSMRKTCHSEMIPCSRRPWLGPISCCSNDSSDSLVLFSLIKILSVLASPGFRCGRSGYVGTYVYTERVAARSSPVTTHMQTRASFQMIIFHRQVGSMHAHTHSSK